MASYYHPHEHMTPTQIPNNNDNLHTLLLMNHPNLPNQQQVSSNNILLLNSAAAAAAAAFSQPSPIFPNHLVRPEDNHVTLYGYPQEAAKQGLSLSLSQHNDNPQLLLGSKYLRATQELLEEVVNVGDIKTSSVTTSNNNNGEEDHSYYSPNKGKAVADTLSSDGREKDASAGTDQQPMTTVERNDIQMKKAKLVTMLDEAEQRYKHYNKQMQMVIESFESGAGMGSAKTYTSLALKTISKQFRCLKDAIQGQIRAANKSLGEDDGGPGSFGGKIEGSRLKFIDHQIRQQRALQQLGMIQSHNAWRPQRGLPERSVSVLRAWLFEHFLHPYPKDSDKILLAKQTGLTRGQVSNWFINARVRLWKPMIEEMYNEELKEQERKGSEEKLSSKENSINDEEIGDMSNILGEQNKTYNPPSSFMSVPTSSVCTLNGSLELEGISEGNPKRQRSNNEVVNNGEILIKFGNDDEKERRDSNGYPIIPGGMNFMGGYTNNNNMGDLGRFETEDFNAPRYVQGNGGISLSLGLPPSCENQNHHHQQFNGITETNHTFISPNQSIHQFQRGSDFEFIDIQNRNGFAAQLRNL